MSAVAEQLIAADGARRDKLLARAEWVETELMRCRGRLETARCALLAAQAAAEQARVLNECEAAYEQHRARRDELMIQQSDAYAALDAHDCANAAARGLPHVSIYENRRGN
jgi:hypothetical protein